MAATRVQSANNNGSATTVVVSLGSSSNNGDYIIVGVVTAFTAFAALTGVTDNKSNTYTQVGTGVTVGNGTLYVYATPNITGGASHTITATFSGSGQSNVVMVREYSGIATTTPTDQTGSATGSGTAVSVTAAGATAQAAELSIMFVGTQNTGETLTAGAGYGNTATASGGQGIVMQDGDLASISTPTATGTLSSFSSWAARIITAKEGAISTYKVPKRIIVRQSINRASTY